MSKWLYIMCRSNNLEALVDAFGVARRDAIAAAEQLQTVPAAHSCLLCKALESLLPYEVWESRSAPVHILQCAAVIKDSLNSVEGIAVLYVSQPAHGDINLLYSLAFATTAGAFLGTECRSAVY